MAKRPEGMDPQLWRTQRARTWKRRNSVLNALMLAAIVALLVRYFVSA